MKVDENGIIHPRAELLRRGNRTQMRMAALEQLQHRMAVATEVVEAQGDSGREGIYRAMIALIDYFAGQGIPRATLYPIQMVAMALVDADRGVATPAFKPDTGPGCPPIPLTEHQPRAQRAVIVECCIQQKKLDGAKAFRVEGAAEAARLLRKAGWQPVMQERQLLALREDVTSRPKGDPMRDTYDLMLNSPSAKTRPHDWAQELASHGWVNPAPAGPPQVSR